ncbi:MAG: hypothetical protein AAGB22_08600, partial [Bacteroidota bacterium]
LAKAVEAQGKARVTIEASASKVPTSAYSSNEALAKSRAERAEAVLLKALETAKIGKNTVEIVRATPLVQGPDYQQGTAGNTSIYKPFQYVRFRLE